MSTPAQSDHMDSNLRLYDSKKFVDGHDKTELRLGEQRVFDAYFKGKVLDIGCGTGRTTQYLAKRFHVTGIDYAPAMIERAKRNYPKIDFRVMDARTLDFPEATFDACLFSFVGLDFVYPLEDRIQVLREVRRVLKPGGIFAYDSNRGEKRFPVHPKRLLTTAYAIYRGIREPYFVSRSFFITYRAVPEIQVKILENVGFEVVEHFRTKSNTEMFVARKK